MPNTPNHTPDKVDLDELLQLKRSERPTEAVWEQFDRELHQRMLQTLMKKDPWYVQLVHAFSGRMVQGTALASAAALIAILVVRTSLVTSPSSAVNMAQNSIETGHVAAEPIAVVAELAAVVVEKPSTALLESEVLATPDYAIETFSARDVPGGDNYQRDFGMDRIETAEYDVASYSVDSALSRTVFANTSVASIVF